MPPRIKLAITVLAAAVVSGFGYTNLDGTHDKVAYACFALAAMMVLAIWIFPETGRVKAGPKA